MTVTRLATGEKDGAAAELDATAVRRPARETYDDLDSEQFIDDLDCHDGCRSRKYRSRRSSRWPLTRPTTRSSVGSGREHRTSP